MHSYRQTGDNEWTVGFDRPAQVGSWRAIKAFPTESEAAAYCAFLNGGGTPAVATTAQKIPNTER